MRFKYRIKQALQFLSFAFYPKTTLIACAAFSAIVIGILGIVMAAIPPESNWYNIVFVNILVKGNRLSGELETVCPGRRKPVYMRRSR